MTRVLKLFRFEQASGLLIIAAMMLGLVAANSPLAPLYTAVVITENPIRIRFMPTRLRVTRSWSIIGIVRILWWFLVSRLKSRK